MSDDEDDVIKSSTGDEKVQHQSSFKSTIPLPTDLV